jgi:mgtE-like transporter
MSTTRDRLRARLSALLGPDPAGVVQGLGALSLGLVASLVAGLTLGSITETLERLPGLLVLVPAAIGLRGTIFGAMGSRLGTSIHTGTFSARLRTETVLGQNLLAAGVLTLVTAVVLAVFTKAFSVGFGIEDSISIPDLLVISFLGATISSLVLAVFTVALAASSTRYQWDPDNVMAPLVTATGDLITLPTLYLATLLLDFEAVVVITSVVALMSAVVSLALALRSRLDDLRQILRESLIVVIAAGTLSLVAGLTLQGGLDSLATYPALLALVPAFLASAGSLGGILSNRLTSRLHLGTIEPTTVPTGAARRDILDVYLLAVPIFALASVVADLISWVADLRSPGPVAMVGVALVGGLMATTCSAIVAYYGAIVSYRAGIDPDNVGIPLVTSSIDLAGSLSFIIAVALLGVA